MLPCRANMIIKWPWRTNAREHLARLTAIYRKGCKLVETISAWPVPVRMVCSIMSPYVVMASMYLLSYGVLSAVCQFYGLLMFFASFPDSPHASWCGPLLNEIRSFCMWPLNGGGICLGLGGLMWGLAASLQALLSAPAAGRCQL